MFWVGNIHPWTNRSCWVSENEQVHVLSGKYAGIAEHVFARDNHTCCYCGFCATKHMEIHHQDLNHSNWKTDNLQTICQFCHAVFHIGHAVELGTVDFAWIPELSQLEINRLARAAYIAQSNKDSCREVDIAHDFSVFASTRKHMFHEIVDFSTGVDQDLAYFMVTSPKEDYRVAALNILYNLRMVPKPLRLVNRSDTYAEVVTDFRDKYSHFAEMPIGTWFDIDLNSYPTKQIDGKGRGE